MKFGEYVLWVVGIEVVDVLEGVRVELVGWGESGVEGLHVGQGKWGEGTAWGETVRGENCVVD